MPPRRWPSYFRRSRIFSNPARAQLSSNLAPGAPLAPIAPIVSSPSLITIPPPKNMTCGSFASGAIESSPFARSAKAMVSFLKETLVYALSRALSSVCMPAPSPRTATIVAPSASSTTAVWLTAFNHLIRGRSACELRPRRVARTCEPSGQMLTSDLLLNDAGMSAGFSPRRSKPVAGGGADAQRRGFGFTHDLSHVICDKLAAAFDDAPVDQDSVDVGGTGPHHHSGLDIRDGRDIGIVAAYQDEVSALADGKRSCNIVNAERLGAIERCHFNGFTECHFRDVFRRRATPRHA